MPVVPKTRGVFWLLHVIVAFGPASTVGSVMSTETVTLEVAVHWLVLSVAVRV